MKPTKEECILAAARALVEVRAAIIARGGFLITAPTTAHN